MLHFVYISNENPMVLIAVTLVAMFIVKMSFVCGGPFCNRKSGHLDVDVRLDAGHEYLA